MIIIIIIMGHQIVFIAVCMCVCTSIGTIIINDQYNNIREKQQKYMTQPFYII